MNDSRPAKGPLPQCEHCGGFTPRAAVRCPHCRSNLGFKLGATGLIGGSVIAFTLMACYGRPMCSDGSTRCHEPKNDPTGQGTDAAKPDTADDAGR